MKKNCDSCGFLNKENTCLLDRIFKPDPSQAFCEKYRNSVPRCDACGLLTMEGILTETREGWRIICGSCYSKINTCDTCQQVCGIQNDNSGIPKTIIQKVQQGNMIFQTNVLNPELVKKYCSNCQCFINNQCMRSETYCSHYNGLI